MQFPDTNPATILIAYRSGKRHEHVTDVAKARDMAARAIAKNANAIDWVRVEIPDLDSGRVARFFWARHNGWFRRDR